MKLYFTLFKRWKALNQLAVLSGIILFFTTNISSASVTYNWNAGTSSGTASETSGASDPHISGVGSVTRANGGSSNLEDNGSPVSSGYSGASGNYNFEAHALAGTTVNTASSTYFSIILTPVNGYAITLDSISLGSRSTSTGPTAISIYSSIDNFSTAIGTVSGLSTSGTWALESPTLSGDLTGSSGTAVELRIYGYDGTSGGSSVNWHIDDINFTVTSSLAPVPEPATWGAISGIGLLGLCGFRAWRQRRSAKIAAV